MDDHPLAPLPFDHPIWSAPALWHPDAPRDGWAVVCFRRVVVCERPRKAVRLLVSACQRFECLVDGDLVARGPSRADPDRWGVVDAKLPALDAGEHVVAIRVAHFGRHAGIGQMGDRGFLLLAGRGAAAELADADGWRCFHDRSRTPEPRHAWGARRPYMALGAGERIDGAKAPWGWAQPGYDARDWSPVKVVAAAAADTWGHLRCGHRFRAEPLPAMTAEPVAFARVAIADDDRRRDAETLIAGDGPLRIPANREVRLVLDRGELTNAYPRFELAGGAGARCELVHAEAPFTGEGHDKGDRDEVAGKVFYGQRDRIVHDGGARTYTTLHFRCLRYLELRIATAEEPLRILRCDLIATGFPLRRRSRCAGRDVDRRLETVSWQTLRCCAHETFFDCPAYEQAQFPGDTRVQAVAHYLCADEDRLARKAIDDFHASRLADGLLQCRYPSRQVQLLPTFALQWIGICHDFLRYRGDAPFLARYLPAAREVCGWFLELRRDDGLLGLVPHAPFVDWSPGFARGNAPQERDGGSAILTAQLAEACGWLADLERNAGTPAWAARWRTEAQALRRALVERCWNPGRNLLADTPRRRSHSHHAQIQAVLAGCFPPTRARALLRRAEGADDLIRIGSFYYRYFQWRAWQRAGDAAAFLPQLDRWRNCLEGSGLTTWPETEGAHPRSDCHAWSVTPALVLRETVLGVTPAAPGFAAAHLAPAGEARGTVPTPHGPIRVASTATERGYRVQVDSPVPVIVPGRKRPLSPGKRNVVIRPH